LRFVHTSSTFPKSGIPTPPHRTTPGLTTAYTAACAVDRLRPRTADSTPYIAASPQGSGRCIAQGTGRAAGGSTRQAAFYYTQRTRCCGPAQRVNGVKRQTQRVAARLERSNRQQTRPVLAATQSFRHVGAVAVTRQVSRQARHTKWPSHLLQTALGAPATTPFQPCCTALPTSLGEGACKHAVRGCCWRLQYRVRDLVRNNAGSAECITRWWF
jgi:hypothetical protein